MALALVFVILHSCVFIMSDPAIKDGRDGLKGRKKTCDAMVAIKDSIQAIIQHEDDRGRDTSSLRAELMSVEESLRTLREFGIFVGYSEFVASNQAVYDALRVWMEANRRDGHFTPFPAEFCNVLHQEVIEDIEPVCSAGGIMHRPKRPTVSSDERTQIHVKHLIGHVDHDLPRNV